MKKKELLDKYTELLEENLYLKLENERLKMQLDSKPVINIPAPYVPAPEWITTPQTIPWRITDRTIVSC